MARALTKKQKGFVKDYIDTGNATLAVKKNYKPTTEKTAGVIGSENLGKPSIQEAIQNHAEAAESEIFKLSQKAKAEAVRLSASKDIMDRAGYGAVNKSESRTLNVNIDVDDDELDELRKEYEDKLEAKLRQ